MSPVRHDFAVSLSHLCKCLCGSHSPQFCLSPSHLCKCLCGSRSPRFRLSPSLICANSFVSRVCHDFVVPLSHLCKGLCESHSPRFRLSPFLICANAFKDFSQLFHSTHAEEPYLSLAMHPDGTIVSRIRHDFTCPPFSCANAFVGRICHDFACSPFSSVQIPL